MFELARLYCFGPMNIAQDPDASAQEQAWRIYPQLWKFGTGVQMVRPCNKGSNFTASRHNGGGFLMIKHESFR